MSKFADTVKTFCSSEYQVLVISGTEIGKSLILQSYNDFRGGDKLRKVNIKELDQSMADSSKGELTESNILVLHVTRFKDAVGPLTNLYSRGLMYRKPYTNDNVQLNNLKLILLSPDYTVEYLEDNKYISKFMHIELKDICM